MMEVGKTNVHFADNLAIKVETAARLYEEQPQSYQCSYVIVRFLFFDFAAASYVPFRRYIGRFDENFNAMEYSVYT